jgi:hypothetical protein
VGGNDAVKGACFCGGAFGACARCVRLDSVGRCDRSLVRAKLAKNAESREERKLLYTALLMFFA